MTISAQARPESAMTSVSEPRWPMRKTLPATSPRPTPKATPYLSAAWTTSLVLSKPSGTTMALTVSE